ncbi:MAG: beta-galactosidase, partial [Planctomycetota bacterium]
IYYDYHLSAFLKGLLWLVPEKAPVVTPAADNLRVIQAAYATLPGAVEGGAITLPKGMSATLRAEARDLFGTVIPLKDQRLKSGSNPLRFTLPLLHGGDWFVDYRVVSKKGTEYWGSLGVEVTDVPATLAGINVSPTPFVAKEGFRAHATIAGALKGVTLRYWAIDHHGRKIFHGEQAVKSGNELIRSELAHAVTKAHALHVELVRGRRILDRAEAAFLVKQPMPRFVNMIWGGGRRGIFGALADRQLEAADFNLTSLADRGMVNDMDTWDYTFRVTVHAPNKKDPTATFADEGYFYKKFHGEFGRQGHQYMTAQRVSRRKHHISLYNLGDENSLSYERPLVAPAEERAFRAFIEKTYRRKIETLNTAWGTAFKSFDEVKVPDITKLKAVGDMPLRHLWMHFVEKLYADTHQRAAIEVRKLDPDPTKIIGAEGSHMGDPELTLKGMTMWGPYANRLDNVMMRSFGTPELLRSNWWGGYLAQRDMGAQPLWDMVLSGGANASFYFMDLAGEGMLSMDLSLADYFVDTQLAGIREVMAGIGTLVGQTPTSKVGLGVYFSMASDHALGLDTRFGVPGSSRDNLLLWAEKVGIPAYLYSDTLVQAGRLDEDGVKVLFLPQVLCLNPRATRKIDTWVKNGGIVIADVRPGLRNERAELNKAGLLDRLFGVVHDPAGAVKEVKVDLPLSDGQRFTMEKLFADSSLKVKTPKGVSVLQDADGTPIGIERVHGKGKALLLNFGLGKLIANRVDDPLCRRLMNDLIERGGLFTGLTVPAGYAVNRFSGEGYNLFACRITPEGEPGGRVELGEPWYAYDVRGKKALGEITGYVPSELAERNTLLTLVKKPIEPLTASCERSAGPGDILTLRIAVKGGEGLRPKRLLRVSLLDATGKEAKASRQFLDLSPEQDEITTRVPLAFNQTKGAYRIELTDILTGTDRNFDCIHRRAV